MVRRPNADGDDIDPVAHIKGRQLLRAHVSNPDSGRDPTDRIKALYAEGRYYPDGKPHETSYRKPVQTPQWPHRGTSLSGGRGLGGEPEVDQLSVFRNLPQGPEDRQAPAYWNDTADGWLRGMNPGARKSEISHHYPGSEKADATHRPFFDSHRGTEGFAKRGGRDGVTEGVPSTLYPDESVSWHHDNPEKLARHNPKRGSRDRSLGGVPGHELYNMRPDKGGGMAHKGKYKRSHGKGKGPNPFSAAHLTNERGRR